MCWNARHVLETIVSTKSYWPDFLLILQDLKKNHNNTTNLHFQQVRIDTILCCPVPPDPRKSQKEGRIQVSPTPVTPCKSQEGATQAAPRLSPPGGWRSGPFLVAGGGEAPIPSSGIDLDIPSTLRSGPHGRGRCGLLGAATVRPRNCLPGEPLAVAITHSVATSVYLFFFFFLSVIGEWNLWQSWSFSF